MDHPSDLSWYAIHTKPSREALALGNIRSIGVEAFFPRLRRELRTRTVVKPLFPGYLFARFQPVSALQRVRYSQGVIRVVSTGQFPLPIDDEIIAGIRAHTDAEGCVQFVPPGLHPGDRVEIEHGPLQGLIGRIAHEEDDRQRVMILLETILQARVSVHRDWLSGLPDAA